ncbi:MAG: hypothetical protein A2Z21_01210 [Candidatus Fraserbacteria bacterium RBG_16_55_9]|uniref:EF-hand domain-containing protein n=1 Tax=Fraserbacteria sp. (strain RBG_16_55_9) TaxID=1817864 RepID=A0A1F5UQ60_FRAXR|nr:MAG: hypothetical protein A2Z21_01210 [Candidatus Fraserbacteria bacterium RBG_16_55_9]
MNDGPYLTGYVELVCKNRVRLSTTLGNAVGESFSIFLAVPFNQPCEVVIYDLDRKVTDRRNVEFGSAPTPTPEPLTEIASFDMNHSGYIEDPEFFAAIDQYTSDSITDQLFFAVLDAWLNKTPIGGSATSIPVQSKIRVEQRNQEIIFTLPGRDFSTVMLEIFDSYGRRIFSDEGHRSRMIWKGQTELGSAAANGGYLYILTVTSQGRTVRQTGVLLALR